MTDVHPHLLPGETPSTVVGGSQHSALDKVTVIAGHLSDARNPAEALVNLQAAQEMGAPVGTVIRVPF